MPVKWDLSRTLSPVKSLSVSSAEEFLSEIEPSVMSPRNLIGLEWMEGMEDETSGCSDAFETIKSVAFTDLPLTITIEHDLSALKPTPVQVRAGMHWKSKVWAPETMEVIKVHLERT